MLIDEIKNGENRFLEFKEKLPTPETFAKTVVSFSIGALNITASNLSQWFWVTLYYMIFLPNWLRKLYHF